MTTTDHAAEARDLWDNLHEWQEREGDTDETRLVQAIEAHAHETAAATLALVEQQRIANLIAAFQMEGGPYKEANHWTDGEEDANVSIRRQVREGLGL